MQMAKQLERVIYSNQMQDSITNLWWLLSELMKSYEFHISSTNQEGYLYYFQIIIIKGQNNVA